MFHCKPAMFHGDQGCYLCGGVVEPTTGLGQDHVIPRVSGGSDEAENLRPCCRQCNRLKGRWTLEEFQRRCESVVYDLPDRHLGRPVSPDRVWLYERIVVHMGW
jgi:5-methylcytosine-specific restriction endonuclease McrA